MLAFHVNIFCCSLVITTHPESNESVAETSRIISYRSFLIDQWYTENVHNVTIKGHHLIVMAVFILHGCQGIPLIVTEPGARWELQRGSIIHKLFIPRAGRTNTAISLTIITILINSSPNDTRMTRQCFNDVASFC